MSSFFRDFFGVGISKAVIIICSVAISIINARWIGPEGNGILASLAVYPSLFMSFGSLGISQSTTYFVGQGIFDERNIKTSITQIWIITAIISVLTCYLLITHFSTSGHNISWVLLSIIPIPFVLFNTYNTGVFLGKNEIGTYNKINWIPSVLQLISTLLFVVLLSLDIKGALFAVIVGPLTMFFILLFRNDFIRYFSLSIDLKVIKTLLSLGIIYAIALLVINLNYKVDIILLDRLSTPYEIGIYSKGISVTNMLWQIPMLLSTLVFARSAGAKEGRTFSLKVAQLLRLAIVFIGFASIIMIFFSKYIILLMFGEEFLPSVIVLQLLLPGILLLTIFKVLNMDLAGKGKPWVSMKAMVPALIINIFLNVVWIPKYGARGAAFSSTISYTMASIIFLFIYCKEVSISPRDVLRFSKKDFSPLIKNLLTLRA